MDFVNTSPLEQFQIFQVGWVTNAMLFMTLAVTILVLFFYNTTYDVQDYSSRVPVSMVSLPHVLSMSLVQFVLGFYAENFSTESAKMRYFPVILSVFVLILTLNLTGLVPYSFTVTSHMSTTFTLGLSLFWGLTLCGIATHRFNFLSLFFPSGTPLWMAPLLVPIELVSYFMRGISLSVRLFANMMAGHALLKILAGFCWTAIGSGSILSYFVVVPEFLLITAIMGLEIGVSLLQAFVFSVLLVVYANDAIQLHG